ncbi:MAG: methanogenesis marker 14 protein [Methanosphaera sp.]|nr:methanogenesis marker 14 protein [Methanosphaera sp.]
MSIEKVSITGMDKSNLDKQYFTVLSVEMGNTTIKSIITASNVKNNKSFQLVKLVRLTRDVRKPFDGETVFGHTIWNKDLSKEAIIDAIRDLILESLSKISMSVDELDFVVRSTGVVAVLSSDDELNYIIQALSSACLDAGIKASQMRAPFSLDNIPEHIRKYSFFNNIEFDGSVVGISSGQLSGVVANEMESELVTAGMKLASKSSSIEYRNPVVSIDMGTTLAGQIVDDSRPYAKVVCNYLGLAGGIMDLVLRGCGFIENNHSTIDVEFNQFNDKVNEVKLHEDTIKLHEFIDIMEVPNDVDEFGCVAVYQDKRINSKVKLIGCRINDEEKLTAQFAKIIHDNPQIISEQIDDFYAYLIKRLMDLSVSLNLISPHSTLAITGRAGITANKIRYIEEYLADTFDNILLVEDALAQGATMMARCMNSLGTPLNPMGGTRNGICIMQERIKYNKNK